MTPGSDRTAGPVSRPGSLARCARFLARGTRYVVNRVIFGLINRCTLFAHGVRHEELPRINGLLRIRNDGDLEIGRRVRINSGQYYNPIGGDAFCSIVVRSGARIRIGDGVGISNSTLHAFTEIDVGSNVQIGGGCRIFDADFHPLDAAARIGPDALHLVPTAAVRIESGAWIGGFSIVLKGVTIGRNAVVGAGSVVTRSIPAGELWAGNPARFIRVLEARSEPPGARRSSDGRRDPESGSGSATN